MLYAVSLLTDEFKLTNLLTFQGNQQFSSDSDETALLSNIVGAGPITGQGGITCTPVTVIGASGTSW